MIFPFLEAPDLPAMEVREAETDCSIGTVEMIHKLSGDGCGSRVIRRRSVKRKNREKCPVDRKTFISSADPQRKETKHSQELLFPKNGIFNQLEMLRSKNSIAFQN
jgi:hypothetical protein